MNFHIFYRVSRCKVALNTQYDEEFNAEFGQDSESIRDFLLANVIYCEGKQSQGGGHRR